MSEPTIQGYGLWVTQNDLFISKLETLRKK